MRRAAVLVLALAAALVAVPSAVAATLKTDTRCYQASQTQDVVVSGTGYTPSKPVSISRDGEAFGTATADAGGAFEVKFPAEELGRKDLEKVFTLSATDAAVNTATTHYRTSKVFADFAPHSGDPQQLKVRFTLNGFGLVRPHASVYLHYVAPNGRSRRDVRLGTARGTCGKIGKSKLRHLFPFDAERGRWILQFDTNKKYTRATTKSPYIWVRKPVEIFEK
jgi:hypothetical protein